MEIRVTTGTQISEVTPAVFNAAEVNTIANKDEKLRGKSKAPTFLLTYRGTYMGLM